jgi:hypothetical protein
MDPALRVVTSWPVRELWNETGTVQARMLRDELSEADVKQMLRSGPVQFVLAEGGAPLQWVALDDRFDFWKQTVQPRLTQWGPGSGVYNDDFPGGFVIASLWEVEGSGLPVVLATVYG